MALYEMRKFVAPEFIFGVGARRRVGFYARNMMARRNSSGSAAMAAFTVSPICLVMSRLSGVLMSRSRAASSKPSASSASKPVLVGARQELV